MAPPSLLYALFALLVALSSAQVLNFNNVTTVTCSNTGNLNFSLTVPTWPSTPATSFIIHFTGASGEYSAYATLDPSLLQMTWTISNDTQGGFLNGQYSGGELWVPYQPAGTVVYVVVDCSAYILSTNVTIEPVIPMPIPASNVAYVNSTSITDGSVAHSHWFALPSSPSSGTFYYFWSELCQVPSTSTYFFNTRVSFPGTEVTGTTCPNWNNAYQVSPSANFASFTTGSGAGPLITYSSITNPSVVYVNIGLYWQYSLIASSFSAYVVSNQADVYYYGFSTYEGHAIEVQDNLFISSIDGGLYPTDTNLMKLYYLDQDVGSKTTLQASFFDSVCYLENNAQSALWTGGLKNGTQDSQMLLSSVEMVKAPNFFKKNKFVSGTFAVTYNNLVVMPIIQDYTWINVPTNYLMFGAVIGLAVYAGIATFGFIGYVIYMRQRGHYQAIGHGHH